MSRENRDVAQNLPSETIPESIIKTPIPEEETQPQEELELKDRIIYSLTVSAIKYSWIVNPTDNFTFKHQMFKPDRNSNYSDIDVRFAEDNTIINKLTYSHFPKREQFYWILPNNIVIFETKGGQGGIEYQARSEHSRVEVKTKLEQAFGGLQAVWNLPPSLEYLSEEEDKNIGILSVAGQLTNPPGIKADRVNINIPESNTVPNVGYASTRNIRGGGALFKNLEDWNTPLILQGFPTVNLQPILDEGRIKLEVGEVISKEVLNATGIFWANPDTGEEDLFTAPITSLPGIKIAREDRFDNKDLLNILVNPFLDKEIDRDLAYLNSLFWVSYGQRQPKITVSDPIVLEDTHWYRFHLSHPHNRTIIKYHSEEISAIYNNIFANPGASVTINFDKNKMDDMQTLNATLGMALGAIFKGISIKKIDNHLTTAKELFQKQENFATVETKATPVQRQQINQRIDRTLTYINSNSGLKQVSGTVTFASKIKPNKSRMFQIRTGLYERGVHFIQRDTGEKIEGETFFSLLRLSNKDFGPLTFIGTPIFSERDSQIKKSQTINKSSAAKTIITTPDGQKIVREIDSAETEVIPIGIKTYDLAFDRIELTRIDRQNIDFKQYIGYLNLPVLETAFSGSQGNFNYSLNAGMWFNLDRNLAPGITNNNLGIQEPTLGFYFNSLLGYQFSTIELDTEQKPRAIHTHTPVLKLNWNSSSNVYNPFLAVASYSYLRQGKNLKFSLTPGIAFIEQNNNGELVGIFDSNINIKNNLEFDGNAEIGREIFFSLEGLKRIFSNLAIGAYLQNYSLTNIDVGLNSRIANLNYGLLIRHNFKDNNVLLEGKIGTGEKGFDARFEGGYRF